MRCNSSVAPSGFDLHQLEFLRGWTGFILSTHLSLPQGVVVTVPGDHHVHLNHPEIVAPVVSDFLQSNDSAHLPSSADDVTAKL